MTVSDNIFRIRLPRLERFARLPLPDVGRWLRVPMRDVVLWLYFSGVLLVFYTTLTPWFLWPLHLKSQFLAVFPIAGAMLLSRTLSSPLFTRRDYQWVMLTYCLCAFTIALLNGRNINGFIGEVLMAFVFLSIFMLRLEDLMRLGDVLAQSMALLLVPSIICYFLYLADFPMPHYPISMPDSNYSFENYRFFLLDDRFAMQLVPRFHAVFLEPAHLAIACVTLLLSQVGQWRRWYNIVLIVALIMSFSLAGYILMVYVLLAASWMKGRAIVAKVVALVVALALGATFVAFYNDGDNLVNELILQRMEVNDEGEMEGDNRVSDDFNKQFETFMQSDHVLTGMGYETFQRTAQGGNSGFRVFLYCNGFISLFLLLVFFAALLFTSHNTRGKVAMLLFHAISFIPHAIPLRLYLFLPLYIVAFREVMPQKDKTEPASLPIAHGTD